MSVVFTCFIGCDNVKVFKDLDTDLSKTPDCQRLLRDPKVLEYANAVNVWDEGIIDWTELREMEIYQKEAQLKEKYNQ